MPTHKTLSLNHTAPHTQTLLTKDGMALGAAAEEVEAGPADWDSLRS